MIKFNATVNNASKLEMGGNNRMINNASMLEMGSTE